MTDAEWAYLESLPRVTLAQRIAYWELRHALEDAEDAEDTEDAGETEDTWVRRVRPYIDPARSCTVDHAGPQWPYVDRRRTEM